MTARFSCKSEGYAKLAKLGDWEKNSQNVIFLRQKYFCNNHKIFACSKFLFLTIFSKWHFSSMSLGNGMTGAWFLFPESAFVSHFSWKISAVCDSAIKWSTKIQEQDQFLVTHFPSDNVCPTPPPTRHVPSQKNCSSPKDGKQTTRYAFTSRHPLSEK